MEGSPKKLDFTNAEFMKIKEGSEAFYKKIGHIHCPFFKESVNFNAEGLEHLKFARWNHARLKSDQFMRLKLLHFAPDIIQNSKTLQGISEEKIFIRTKRNKRWEKALTNVTYYEFIAVLEHKRIKVIVKQIEGGEKFFWTMIPYWRMDNYNKRVLHDGKPEID